MHMTSSMEPRQSADPANSERVIISGASGLVGTRLSAFLEGRGTRVERLVRHPPEAGVSAITWDPSRGTLDSERLEGVGAVVHLAGESIATGRWTEERKDNIRKSRVDGTSLLARRLAALKTAPRVLVSASAIGIYGDRGDNVLDENSEAGDGFLAEVCQVWERSLEPAIQAGIRVVKLRIGIVLSRDGGALKRMLPAFRVGLAGVVGSGRQYMSWIAIEDLIRIVDFVLSDDGIEGPVNAVAPNPVTNAQFTKTLG